MNNFIRHKSVSNEYKDKHNKANTVKYVTES